MDTRFQLFPDAASTIAGRVDALYVFLVAVGLFFTFLICALILWFGVKYRRDSPASRENPPTSIWLEITWSLIPLALTMVMFTWGAEVFHDQQRAPPAATTIEVVGKQWMWKVQHPDGRGEINELHIPIGTPVRLHMISEDVIHSFYVPAFRVKQDVLPGYYTSLWFEATRTGRFHLFCAEYCGTGHSRMRGTVVIMEQAEFADWLAGDTREPAAVVGERLFERHRCGSCHKPTADGQAPSLVGAFGRQTPLQGGGFVTADDQYLRDSILNPQQQIVDGYQPLMPTFQGQLSEADVLRIIAYLKTLTAAGPTETR